jgi:hypothetical protein
MRCNPRSRNGVRTSHETKQKRNGKALRRYEVVWRESVRDSFGLPTGKTRARQETHVTREAAEARRDELNARHTTGTSALADQRKAGEWPLGTTRGAGSMRRR